jgi:hypothetical protein
MILEESLQGICSGDEKVSGRGNQILYSALEMLGPCLEIAGEIRSSICSGDDDATKGAN